MNITTYTQKRNTGKETNFTVSVSIVYIVLLAAMLLFTDRYASAGMNSNYENHFESDFLTTLTVVGHGELTWFGIPIYHASLWTRTGKFYDIEQSNPIALAITYQKNIDSAALAKRTVEEWEHLGIFDSQTRLLWGGRLEKVWPDVKPDDNITTLITPDNKTRFYHNDKLIAVFNDPEFGKALLSIWLDSKTSEPALRKKLIGNWEE